jgi:hypothetical protein
LKENAMTLEVESTEYLKEVVSDALELGLFSELAEGLSDLARQGDKEWVVKLYKDFAPLSFAFSAGRYDKESGEFKQVYNGGLIYQGPNVPGDGSFPSLSVSLHSNTGWFVHT